MRHPWAVAKKMLNIVGEGVPKGVPEYLWEGVCDFVGDNSADGMADIEVTLPDGRAITLQEALAATYGSLCIHNADSERWHSLALTLIAVSHTCTAGPSPSSMHT